jgi:hypothetical protein
MYIFFFGRLRSTPPYRGVSVQNSEINIPMALFRKILIKINRIAIFTNKHISNLLIYIYIVVRENLTSPLSAGFRGHGWAAYLDYRCFLKVGNKWNSRTVQALRIIYIRTLKKLPAKSWVVMGGPAMSTVNSANKGVRLTFIRTTV